MAKYRKKPVIVEASQWLKHGDHPAVSKYNATGECNKCARDNAEHGWVDTLESGHVVCPGDWIITGVKGECYPCKPDVFEKTYEKISG